MASLDSRFESKYVPEPNTGCWLWTSALDLHGYGVFGIGGRANHKTVRAHRLSYELYRANIPFGLDIDHLCRVRCCVNPNHLEPVTRSVNVSRGLIPGMNRTRRNSIAACPNGHEYTADNAHVGSNGRRYCKECKRERTKEYRRIKHGR